MSRDGVWCASGAESEKFFHKPVYLERATAADVPSQAISCSLPKEAFVKLCSDELAGPFWVITKEVLGEGRYVGIIDYRQPYSRLTLGQPVRFNYRDVLKVFQNGEEL